MFTRDIKQWIDSLKEKELILAKQAYEEKFSEMKEATFYQLLARLCDEKYIGKIAKGLYYKPKRDNYEELPSEEKLVAFFTNKNKNGMIVGEKMLNEYGIISQEVDKIEIFTNVLDIKTRRCVNHLEIQSLEVDFRNPKILKTVQALEIVENISEFTNVNLENLKHFFEDFAYLFDIAIFNKVLSKRTYKKRNIAAIKTILDSFGVTNNLNKYLNTASKYSFPDEIQKALNL